jgi:hypothetical protein
MNGLYGIDRFAQGRTESQIGREQCEATHGEKR